MLRIFLLSNLGFATNLLLTLVFLAIGWLYLDSWTSDKDRRTYLARAIGLFLLSLTYLFNASGIESEVLVFASQIIKILSLSVVLVSLLAEDPVDALETGAFVFPFALTTDSLLPLSAALFLLIAITYLRKVHESGILQLRPPVWGFIFLFLAELASIAFFWSDAQVVFWNNVLSQYGPLWITVNGLQIIGGAILVIWAWGYLRFRVGPQILFSIVAVTFSVFFLATVSFTLLLLRNLENETLDNLETQAELVRFTIGRLESETETHARSAAEFSSLMSAIEDEDGETMFDIASNFLATHDSNLFKVTNAEGELIVSGEDSEAVGDSLIDDPLIKNALSNLPLSTLNTREGALVPEVLAEAAHPYYLTDDEEEEASPSGVIITGIVVDSAFVNELRDTTKLETTIFAGGVRSATTFASEDGTYNYVGTSLEDEVIENVVLENGSVYKGRKRIFNQPYYVAYIPIRGRADETIGIISTAQHQSALVDTLDQANRASFLATAILLLASLGPAYFVARFMKSNVEA